MKKAIKFLEKRHKSLTCEEGVPLEEGLIEEVNAITLVLFILEEEDKANINNDNMFAQFYALYPLKKSKAPALNAFKKLNPDQELFQKIMDAVTAQKASRQWQTKQYIPHPSTWLNQERWEDEVEGVDAAPVDSKYAGI